MKSINFEFLQKSWPDLAALGGFSETYAHSDPQSALVKLRLFVERMVGALYQMHGLPKPIQPTLNDLLNNDVFRDLAPRPIYLKFHAIRDAGNKAAHGETVSKQTALWLIKEAYDLARWFFVAFARGEASLCGQYQEPKAENQDSDSKAKLKEQKKAILEKLSAQEAQLQALFAELEQSRTQVQNAEQKLADIAESTAKGQQVADVFKFDEATTRKRLIDRQIADAGWHIGNNGTNTEQVGQEIEVNHQPTNSETGRIDYVLWDDNGKPLAIIEAKKASENAEKGRTQARIYADGLEKDHGQRPVIFYTNGFDIWIWDDQQGYPPRKIFGFYSKDSLQYLVYQRRAKQALNSLSPKAEIAGRLYQIETIKRVTERFANQYRKGLIVQATGTGKTRVAIALTELLIRAGWVKRVLFLCDRRELRKQAKDAFNDYLNEPLVTVGASTAKDRQKRIYLATYPAMAKVFQTFDVGFFDLVIADESHRSIYNVYGDIFRYFDCLQVGLTATPVEFVTRNTFQLFECENQAPTAYYSFERAVEEHYLVPFEVQTYTTDFLRRGIKYQQLTNEQRQELEDLGEDAQTLNFEVRDIDKNVYNKDTNRHIIRNLMENGIRDASGQQVGKTIIFARNHEHALLLRNVFDEMYPQYGGKVCQVIDNYDPRAEQLIDDFKQLDNELTIAVSVDMLDTGIDVPEVVNLVFAKPVFSKVKFWQMIGRGTRLCPNLFGLGKDKTGFRIFDHWGNFDYFEFHYKPVEPVVSKPLLQQLFETRIALADAALQAAEPEFFEIAEALIAKDINQLPDESIAVREKWRTKQNLSQPETLHQWAPATVAGLKTEIAPLMQWVSVRGATEVYELDLLIARMQIELLRNSSRFDDLKITLMDRVNGLQMHLNQVREKAELIKNVRATEFWNQVTVPALEDVRKQLRDIIHHQASSGGGGTSTTKIIDITEDTAQIESGQRSSTIRSVDMKVYQQQVDQALRELFDTDPTLKKIRRGESVSTIELENLTSLVLIQHPDVRLDVLKGFYGEALPMDHIIRSIVGMEPDAVRERFEWFVQKHPLLTAKQTQFLSLLQNHIAKYGAIEIERLYEDPFTLVDADGIDGVFNNEADSEELIAIINTFKPSHTQERAQ
ncbi:DEAD/DEAH box helicase family protein [Methylomonas sp. SURF-2]|uniref:DEAD/DEAH box helicase family protein n=1 Tax=Methylomonas subterranea TaxID=2952225 RepID=A0ABT1TLA1_9GAMM|nr:DEAD/DEAH box helicase family protein [Methylomonas sp. SURF-2]MCQ8105991.1 DEAD/DEAH box helicase family protein [Methylomonas sp. SURF-2]